MSRRRRSKYNGLLAVRKAPGPTSHDVVDMARRALGERRIGHTGTLDPMAEGVLLLCVGVATRLQQFLLQWDKTYHGVIRLGTATDTYDSEGTQTEPSGPPPELDEGALRRLETRFTGDIDQRPPPYSAKKVGGKKLYELARNGETVDIEPKRVHVERLSIVPGPDQDTLLLEATTSSGFYVRTLAHDIGVELGCGAHLAHLDLVSIGPYTSADALCQEKLQEAQSTEEVIVSPAWRSIDEIALPYPDVEINPSAEQRFLHGQEVIVFRAGGDEMMAASRVTVHSQKGALLGVGSVQSVLARGRTLSIRPTVVLIGSGVNS